jgi:hypothetical protein
MKRLVCIALGSLLITASAAAAAPHKDKPKSHGKQAVSGDDRADTRVAVQVSFTAAELRIIREHYAPRYRNLPPGLQKKVARGGQLPPGWQKKYEPFSPVVERRLGPLSPEYRRGVCDGHAIIYNPRTNVVIDVAVLF